MKETLVNAQYLINGKMNHRITVQPYLLHWNELNYVRTMMSTYRRLGYPTLQTFILSQFSQLEIHSGDPFVAA